MTVNMEILRQNFLNTTTMVVVGTGTDNASNLFNRNRSSSYVSVGKNTETSGVTIGVDFSGTSRSIDRIVLQNINLKGFRIYHSSNTSNTITLTSTSDTTTSIWTGNSATSLYLIFATIQATSIFIDGTTTIAGSEEKKVGEFWVTEKRLRLERNPTAKDYKPSLKRKEFKHSMAEGGTTSYIVGSSYNADLKLRFRNETETAALLDLYDDEIPFVFVPFPTSTGWTTFKNERIHEVIWVRDFTFQHEKNNTGVGYSLRARMEETPR